VIQALKIPSPNPNPRGRKRGGEEEREGGDGNWWFRKESERVGRERDIYPPLTLD